MNCLSKDLNEDTLEAQDCDIMEKMSQSIDHVKKDMKCDYCGERDLLYRNYPQEDETIKLKCWKCDCGGR